MVKGIIDDMLENFDNTLVKHRVNDIMNDIVKKVLDRATVREIVDFLFKNLPLKGTDEEYSIVEMTAEKLYTCSGVEITDMDIIKCATDIVEEILESAIAEKGHSVEMITKLVQDLVQELPIDILTKDDVMNMILCRLTESLTLIDIDKEELTSSIMSLTGPLADDMRTILAQILEKVFGIGIDYLYIINERFKQHVDDNDNDNLDID